MPRLTPPSNLIDKNLPPLCTVQGCHSQSSESTQAAIPGVVRHLQGSTASGGLPIVIAASVTTGSKPFACITMPALAGPGGYFAMDIPHNTTWEIK